MFRPGRRSGRRQKRTRRAWMHMKRRGSAGGHPAQPAGAGSVATRGHLARSFGTGFSFTPLARRGDRAQIEELRDLERAESVCLSHGTGYIRRSPQQSLQGCGIIAWRQDIDFGWLGVQRPSPEPRAPLRPLNSGYSDRLIPSRAGSNLESGLDLMESGSPGQGEEASFARLLRKELLGQSSQSSDREETLLRTPERGLFRYRRKNEDDCSLLTGSTCAESPVKVQRKFPQAPYKVLSAPNLEDDYYLNVLDWSAEDNLAVGLGSSVDLWNAFSGRASRLCELDRPVASIRWSHEAGRFDRVALGLADGEVQIWDASVGQKVQSLQGHLRRTCALAWADASLFSGSQDTHIFRWDMRTPSPVQNLQGHTEEVCGLAWSKELRVLASGGNEGAVNLWTDQGELRRLGCHQAACRALAWSPKGVLATGGGTADRTIRLWTASGTQTSCVQTEAQVCSLAWSPSGDGELISTHGFSTYEVNLWKTTGGLVKDPLQRVKVTGSHPDVGMHTRQNASRDCIACSGTRRECSFSRCLELSPSALSVAGNDQECDPDLKAAGILQLRVAVGAMVVTDIRELSADAQSATCGEGGMAEDLPCQDIGIPVYRSEGTFIRTDPIRIQSIVALWGAAKDEKGATLFVEDGGERLSAGSRRDTCVGPESEAQESPAIGLGRELDDLQGLLKKHAQREAWVAALGPGMQPEMEQTKRILQDRNLVKSLRYDSQFYKTKLCMFFQSGRCSRKFCKFAHGMEELQRAPDLRKTAMCKLYVSTGHCDQEGCSFAHSLDELRATDKFHKTTMCCFHYYGSCKLGELCRHAHSKEELRSLPELPGLPQSLANALLAESNGGAMKGLDMRAPRIPGPQPTEDLEAQQSQER
ncbi:unnamed protein product [Effrenium voratum]|nr:unnamed protein product [Effrenium voratum]